MITNISIATGIALRATVECGLPAQNFMIESVDHAAYEGVAICYKACENRMLHVYLCDDDADAEMWMLDPSTISGDVDPRPLTGEFMQFCLEWLFADAWLLREESGKEILTTDYHIAREWPAARRHPLSSECRGGLLVGWFDPTTGDLGEDSGAHIREMRFTKPLYTILDK